jgi:hypothetical protein
VTVTVIVTPTQVGSLTNTATVAITEPEISNGNNTAVITTTAVDNTYILFQPVMLKN